MPAWFDIESLDRLEEETDIEGVKRSAEVVFDIIEGEIRNGIPSDRIIIGGFSQGAALALYCSLHCPQNLAACIILSGFFPETRLPDPNILTNKEIPYFQAHGESDNILPLRYGLDTSEKLKQFLKFHEFRTYNMQHETSDRELSDMKLFIEKVVGHWIADLMWDSFSHSYCTSHLLEST